KENRPMARSTTNRPNSPASPADSEKPAAASPRKSRKPKETPAMTQIPAEQSVAAPAPASSPAGSAPASPKDKRFDIFVVDVDWHRPIADALRKNLEKCLRYSERSTVYILTQDQCADFFRAHPSTIGTEPSLIVLDREALAANRSQGFGFKLNLGLIRDYAT